LLLCGGLLQSCSEFTQSSLGVVFDFEDLLDVRQHPVRCLRDFL
jgi:hypothetical protein